MPTLLESLFFEIGIDTKKLKGDAKEADSSLKQVEDSTRKASHELEERGKKSGQVFRGLREDAGAFFQMVAAAYGGRKIASMSKDIMMNAEALGFMAQNLGMSTERLDSWRMASEKNGGTAAGMVAQLQSASTAVAMAKRGMEFPGRDEFFRQGGNVRDLESVESYMDALSRIISPYFAPGGDAVQGMNVANLLGINPDAINLLKQGPDAVREMVRAQEEAARVSGKLSKDAHDTLNAFRDIGNSLKGIGATLLESINPEMKAMADYAKKAAEAINSVENKARLQENASQARHEVIGAAAGRLVGRKVIVTGGEAAGKLAGRAVAMGRLGGPLGAIATDFLMPRETASQAQEDEALRQWRLEHNGGVSEQQKRLNALEKEKGLPPGVLDSVWQQESGRGKNMLSPAGAEGHFQFMPATWKAYGKGGNPYDFNDASEAAANYLKDLLKQHNGNMNDALAWYNAGGNYRGSQAQSYADQVIGRMNNAGISADNGMPGGQSGPVVGSPELMQEVIRSQRSINAVLSESKNIGGATTNNNRTDVSVNGPVTINTQSTDPQGIKQEFADNMGSYRDSAALAEQGTF